jgi:hypothetical protein
LPGVDNRRSREHESKTGKGRNAAAFLVEKNKEVTATELK